MFAIITLQGCVEENQGHSATLSDTSEDTEDVFEEEITIVPCEDPDPEPDPECIECAMYFCPPLDSIWRKEICMNI